MTFRGGDEGQKDSSPSFPSVAFFRVNLRLFRTIDFHREEVEKPAVHRAGARKKWPVVVFDLDQKECCGTLSH